MKQGVPSNEIVDELKKKVLELRDVIDKQDGEIEKYQIALEIASVDIVKCIEEGLEGCSVCPERIYCKAHRHDTIRLECGEILLESWKKKVGIE